MELPTIYNCHIHTFTAEHIPDRFLPLGLVRAMRRPWLRKPILWMFGKMIPRSNKDAAARTGRFLARGAFESQQKVFEYVQCQYPEGTRFIVLPMDMEFMGAGQPEVRFEAQLKELAELRDTSKGTVIPFYAADPRRPNVVAELQRWHREYKIRGVKIYPNLGYPPDDPILLEIYAYCEKKKLPILAHCSPGGIRQVGLSQADARKFTHPANYAGVLKQFPKLNFCLGHFSGAEEWERHLTGGTPRTGPEASWLTVILEMMRSGEYPNLYADVAYTLFTEMPSYRPFTYFDFLKVLLVEQSVREHTLFGTDYYMVEREKVSEKEVSVALRSHLGEENYFQLAHHNPMKYLYETPASKAKTKAKAR
jgi:predicted TIM-barrel fold metal-dependent hydrolase